MFCVRDVTMIIHIGKAIVNMVATEDAEYTDPGAHCTDPTEGQM